MKIFKKILAIIIVASLIISSVALSGCSNPKSVAISFGEWLQMLDIKFGMDSYNSDTPYFKTVDKDNEYFDYVQIACEWNIIDTTDEIDTNKQTTWRDAIVTTVNCGNFLSEESNENEKIDFAKNNFNLKITRKKLDKKIYKNQAEKLLETAQLLWVNQKYETPIEEVSYSKGVIDFTQGEKRTTDYTIDESGTIIIPNEKADNLKNGDIYVLPSNGSQPGTIAYKADSVERDDTYTYIRNSDEELDLYDIAQDIYVQETYSPTSENTIVRDGNGQIVSVGTNVPDETDLSLNNKSMVTPLGVANQSGNTLDCASAKVTHTFEVGDYKVKLAYDLNGKFDLKATVETTFSESETGRTSRKGSFSVGVSDLEITQKVDYSWFQLKEAKLKVDYKNEIEFKYEKSTEKNGVVAPKMSNGNGKYLTNLKKSVLKDENTSKGAKTIKLCSLDVWSIGVCRVCLDVNLQIKLDGTVTITVTEHGSKGFEYKNKNLRQINISDKDVDASFKAKLEGTVGVGPALYVVGLKKAILGLQVKVGLGIEASVTIHLADSENHLLEESSGSEYDPEVYETLSDLNLEADAEAIRQIAEAQGCTYSHEQSGPIKIHCDVCFDVSAYFILKIELTDTSYAADLLGGKIKTSFEIFGSKNGKFMNVHVENFDWSQLSNIKWGSAANTSQCTLKYTPFDKDEETTAQDEITTERTESGSFAISTYSLALTKGESKKIEIDSIPKGYKKSDIKFKSDDEKIATVSDDGTVKAIGSGSTSISVSTADGKYSVTCAVIVSEPVMIYYFDTTKSQSVKSI